VANDDIKFIDAAHRGLYPLLLRDALRWPVVLVLLGLLANGIYNQQSRHLIYSTDDVIPEHGVW